MMRECLPKNARGLIIISGILRKGKTPHALRVQIFSQSHTDQDNAKPGKERLVIHRPECCRVNTQGKKPDRSGTGCKPKPDQDHQKTQADVPFFKPEKERGDHDGNTDKVQDTKNDETFPEEQPGAERDKKPENKDAGSPVYEF